MGDVWREAFFGSIDVKRLKQRALLLKQELDTLQKDLAGLFPWRQKIVVSNRLRKEIKQILDEVDYQEGRLQFANRPYSKPSARILVNGCTKSDLCGCGCWGVKRKEFFKL